LVVGEHLRDWFVIHKTIDEISYRGLDVEFHIVTSERLFPYLTGCANTVYHSQISESQLIDLYGSADVLFMPGHRSNCQQLYPGSPFLWHSRHFHARGGSSGLRRRCVRLALTHR
jgi:hypothetical protein